MILIIGPNGSGKSAVAERLACQLRDMPKGYGGPPELSIDKTTVARFPGHVIFPQAESPEEGHDNDSQSRVTCQRSCLRQYDIVQTELRTGRDNNSQPPVTFQRSCLGQDDIVPWQDDIVTWQDDVVQTGLRTGRESVDPAGEGGSPGGDTHTASPPVSLAYPASLVYIATMVPADEDGNRRIAAHRKSRAGLGFLTIESPDADLARIRRLLPLQAVADGGDETADDAKAGGTPDLRRWAQMGTRSRNEPMDSGLGPYPNLIGPDTTILLEDVSNLLANLTFDTQDKDPVSTALDRIHHLERSCRHLIAVTIGGLEPGLGQDAETVDYIAALNRLNGVLAEQAERVIRMPGNDQRSHFATGPESADPVPALNRSGSGNGTQTAVTSPYTGHT